MTTIEVHLVNAFTDHGGGGNPAGVVLDADNLSDQQKQSVAAEIGFSETAFLSRSHKADFQIDFFTPNSRVNDCGHATVASFSVAHARGLVRGESSKELADGTTRRIFFDNEDVFMEQQTPSYRFFDREQLGTEVSAILDSLGIGHDALLPDHRPLLASTGEGFVLIPLRGESELAGLKPDMEAIAKICDAANAAGYYAFSTATKEPGRDAGARMFCPLHGIPEESATGMAAGPLGTFLFDHLNVKCDHIQIEQGNYMKPASASLLNVKVDLNNGAISAVRVGGSGSIQGTRLIQLA